MASRNQDHPTDPDGYLSEVGKQVFASVGLLAVLWALLAGILALRSVSEEGTTGPRFVLQPIDAGIVAGAYGILAAFVIALQFASRSITPAQKRAQPGATGFLNLLARAILLATLALTAAVLAQVEPAKALDLYRLGGSVKALIAKDYATFAWLVLGSALICLLYLLEIASLSIQGTGSEQLLLRSLTRDVVAFGIIFIGPFCALLPLCTYLPRIGCRGLILDIVSRSFDRRLARLLTQNLRDVKPRVNRLAITAAVVLPFIPLSVLVAHIARIQITKTGERGGRLVRAVLITAAILGVLTLVALLLLVTIPIVGDWCPGTEHEVCWSIER
ncbi:hypothetical protein AB6813_19345 [bacterium RCC_150]